MKHPRFEILDHTADIGLAAYGADLKEAFASAAYGMFSIIAELDRVGARVKRRVEVSAPDQKELLVAWLNELLYLFDAENLLLSRFEVEEMEPGHLTATVAGERANPQRHGMKTAIKSATYHMLEIKEGDGVRVQVIFDL